MNALSFVALDEGAGDVRRGPVCAIDGGSVFILRRLDLRAAAIEGLQALGRLEAVAFSGVKTSSTVTLVKPARVTEVGVPKLNLADRIAQLVTDKAHGGFLVGGWLSFCCQSGYTQRARLT